MKVINGGIPGKPEVPVEIGNVYNQLALINIKRSEQLRQTDLKVNEIVTRIHEQQERDYGNLERQLKHHFESPGLKHGENLHTLGLQMVNDFPFGTVDDVVVNKDWHTYLNPESLSDALQQWRYADDDRVLARGNVFYTKNDLRLDALFDSRGIIPDDLVEGWYDVSPVTYYGGVLAPLNTKPDTTGLAILPYIQNHTSTVGVSLGTTTKEVVVYGWGSGTVKDETRGEYYLLDDYHRDTALSFTDLGDEGDLIHDAVWLGVDGDFTTGYAATCYAHAEGITVGLGKVSYGSTMSLDSTYLYQLDDKTLGNKLITLQWDEWFTGKTVTLDHEQPKVYGGVETLSDDAQLMLFVMVHLIVDGESGLYVFRWLGDRGDNQCLLKLVESPVTGKLDPLPDNHPFHPVYGRGVFKPTGGHISARHYGNRTFFLEHQHDFTTMHSFLEQRGNLISHPITTEQRVVTHRHYSPLGADLGRMLLTNDHTVINAQQHVDGDWSHYLCHYDGPVGVKHTTFNFNHPKTVCPMAERTTLSREFVNTLQSDGKVGLTGTVWSNKNHYQGILDARGKVGGPIYGKPVAIAEEDLTRFKGEHQEWLDFRGGLGYTALVVFNNGGKLEGLEIRTDHYQYIDVAYLEVKLNVAGEYRLTRLGDRVIVVESSEQIDLVSNTRRWLVTDYYAHYRDGECHVMIQNPYQHRPAIVELRLRNEKVETLSTYIPVPDVTGVVDYAPVIMTLDGPCKPDQANPVSGEYTNHYGLRTHRYAGNVQGAGYLVIERGTQLVVNGDPFDIPPGLVARVTPNKKQYVYLALVNGVVETLVSSNPLTRGQLYAVVESDGTVDLKITEM